MAYYKKQSIEAQEKRERKAKAIYEGRESEDSRFPDGADVVGRGKALPGSSTY